MRFLPVTLNSLLVELADLDDLSTAQIQALSTAAIPGLGDDAIAVLQVHPWPGNIRQMRNNIERLLILATGDPNEPISAEMLPQDMRDALMARKPSTSSGESTSSHQWMLRGLAASASRMA